MKTNQSNFRHSHSSSRISRISKSAVVLLATLAMTICMSSESFSAVVVFDGFGDGDLDNNGMAFENTDVVGDYVPFFNADTMMQNDSPALYSANTMVTGPTVADDVNDTGIRWFSSGGFGSSNMGAASSSPRIIDDSAGNLPETVGNQGFFNAISGETQNIAALDSGLALSVESKGRGRSLSGFFETDQDYSNGKQGTIELGSKVGDEVKLSFDFRVWMSAPNYNGSASTNHVPDFGQLRFGLFQDTDNELGQTNNIAGSGFTPAVWGEENGLFRGDFVGPDATGDAGWYVRLPLQDKDSNADPLFDIGPNGQDARINEETNDVGNTGERFLQGSDNQTVALPDQMTPDFVNLDTRKRYKVEFSLERFDETNGSTDPNDDGDNIMATLTVTDIDDPINSTWSLSGADGLDELSGAGFDSDSWDYFSVALAGASDSDEFDFLIDNFTIEVNGSNAPVAGADFDNDGDVDGTDFLLIQQNDPSLIPTWQSEYAGGALAAANAVPEPTTLASVCLAGMFLLGAGRRSVR